MVFYRNLNLSYVIHVGGFSFGLYYFAKRNETKRDQVKYNKTKGIMLIYFFNKVKINFTRILE